MRRTIYSLLLVVVTSALPAHAQWVQQTSGTSSHFWAVNFVDNSTGWAVGGLNSAHVPIVKTTNGGKSWLPQSHPSTKALKSVRFRNGNEGVAVGNVGVVLTTTNGGDTWISRKGDTTGSDLHCVAFASPTVLVAVGRYKTVLRSVDKGQTWSRIKISDVRLAPGSLAFNSVIFRDESNGCIVGDSGAIAVTSDGGTSWIVKSAGGVTFYPLNAVTYDQAGTYWAVGGNGLLFSSNDDGVSWKSHISGVTSTLACVGFTDKLNGYISGQAHILTTKDGGETWQSRISPNDWLLGASFPSDKTGWFVGHGGKIFKTITGGEVLSVVAQNAGQSACKGDAFLLSVNINEGKIPFTYSWQNSDGTSIDPSELVSGSSTTDSSVSVVAVATRGYRVIVIDGNQFSDTVEFSVDVIPSPLAQIREQTKGTLEGLTDLPTSASDYQWFEVSGTAWDKIDLENKPTFRPLKVGTYGLEVTDARNNCTSRSAPYAYGTTSIAEVDDMVKGSISISPNPASSEFTIRNSMDKQIELSLHSVMGQVVVTLALNARSETQFNVSMLPQGQYVLIGSAHDVSFHRLLLIER